MACRLPTLNYPSTEWPFWSRSLYLPKFPTAFKCRLQSGTDHTTAHPGCSVSAIKHRIDRLKKKVNLSDLNAGAPLGTSPRKVPNTSPTKRRRATTMKPAKTRRSPKKTKGSTPEADSSEPESPKLDDESEPESDSESDLVKKEDGDLIKKECIDLIKMEEETLIAAKDANVEYEKEEGEC